MIADLSNLNLGNHRIRCWSCGRSDRDRTLGVTIEPDHLVWHCYRCGTAAQRHDAAAYTRVAAHPTPRQHLTLASHWYPTWRDSRGLSGTIAERYLRARGCALPPEDGDLRYGELRHLSGYIGPCMVALVTDAVTREPMTLHRTWIKPDGTKADVDPPRLLLGKHPKAGGVIRLWPDDAVTTALAIAEGIETSLAVASAFRPVWSCIDAGNLAAFPVLDGIESLLIMADHDAAGLRAAEQCAERWHKAGREVRIAVPPEPRTDAADLARAA